jgi:hypothetical protein
MTSTRPRSPDETTPAAEPAVKKPKLEEAGRVPLMLSPAELDRVIDFVILKSGTVDVDSIKAIKSDAKTAFLPDVSEYIGKIYVSLYIELAGGEVNEHFTTTRKDWQRVQDATDEDAFYLGDVCGKHSEIHIGFQPDFWEFSIDEDPYTIAKMVQMHGDEFPWWIEDYLAKENSE